MTKTKEFMKGYLEGLMIMRNVLDVEIEDTKKKQSENNKK